MSDSSAAAPAATDVRGPGRPVDWQRREFRRQQIADAAFALFAEHGYAGASTAAICRTAGIGSGTLFHHFPTKAAILVAVLEQGTADSVERFIRLDRESDPMVGLLTWLDEVSAELSEPRLAGFVRAVSAVVGEPAISAALAADEASTMRGLQSLVGRAQQTGRIRTDLSAERLAQWLYVLVDGFLGRIAASEHFQAEAEAPLLRDTALRLLRRSPPTGETP